MPRHPMGRLPFHNLQQGRTPLPHIFLFRRIAQLHEFCFLVSIQVKYP